MRAGSKPIAAASAMTREATAHIADDRHLAGARQDGGGADHADEHAVAERVRRVAVEHHHDDRHRRDEHRLEAAPSAAGRGRFCRRDRSAE